MGKSNVKNISRKDFIKLSSISILGGQILSVPLFSSCEKKPVMGEIMGANHKIGHMIKTAISLPVSSRKKIKIAIIGSGVSGLTAGYFLQKGGIFDYQIFELDENIGGNATYGQNSTGKHPWAAHYLPIPNNDNIEILQFLEAKQIIKGYDVNGLPFYDEYSLCFHPNERLLIKGYWQEGLVPNIGLTKTDKIQFERFFKIINDYKIKKGKDGKWAFNIPISTSSTDLAFLDLDKISIATWLETNKFNARPLLWYVSYCLLDDYGTKLEDCSAYAGIHYFASRKGKAANANENDVLTWNEGNGFLMQLLAENQLKMLKTKNLVYKINDENGKQMLDIYDWGNKKRIVYEADLIIYACPQMMRPYMMPKIESDYIKRFTYSPWLVANLVVTPFDTGKGEGLAWDNVIYEGKGLGYISSTHQNLNREEKYLQLTYYKPLTDESPEIERKKAIVKTHSEWVNEIIDDLKVAHPQIENNILRVDIKIWGHAMVRPTVGFINSLEKKKATKSINNKIFFANSDLSGTSIFEEAFYHGHKIANEIISTLNNES